MSAYSQHSPQQTSNMSNDVNLSAGSSQTICSPQPLLELNNVCVSQHWDSIHCQPAQILCDSKSSQHIKERVQLTDTGKSFSLIELSPPKTLPHQDQKQDQKKPNITLSVQRENTTAGHNMAAASHCATAKLTLGSLQPDVKASPCTHLSPIQGGGAAAGLTEDNQPSTNNVLDNTLLSKPFLYSETVDYQDTKDKALNDYTTQSSISGRTDASNKYQSFSFSGHLLGYTPAECLTSGVRPVQSCQDNSEDTSSSDDEGKLIIEL